MPVTDKGQRFRHEWKFEITPADRVEIRQRMRAVARPDAHAKGGSYHIRSLYFDNAADKVLREKPDGVWAASVAAAAWAAGSTATT